MARRSSLAAVLGVILVVGLAAPGMAQVNQGAANMQYSCTITLDDFPEVDGAPRTNSTPCSGSANGGGAGVMDDTPVVWQTRSSVALEDDCDGATGEIQNLCITVTYTDNCPAGAVTSPASTYSGSFVFHGNTVTPDDPNGEDLVVTYLGSRTASTIRFEFDSVFLDMNENGVLDGDDAESDVPFGVSIANTVPLLTTDNICPDAPGDQPLTAIIASGLSPNSH